MDELQKLYDVLFRKGKYTKSFEEFQVKWSQDQAYKDKVYDVVSRDGLYTKDKNSFFQKYSIEESTPKIEQPITQPEQEPINVKKNDLPIGGEDLQDGFDFSQPVSKAPSVLTPQAQQEYIAEQEQKPVKIPVEPSTPDAIPKGFQTYQAPSEEETQGYSKNFLDNLSLGVNNLARVVATIPKATYNVFSLPQNALAWATGLDISTNANKFGKTLGIENPILKQLDEEDKVLNERIQKFNKTNYEDSSVYENIKLGNYEDAFELIGSGIAQSAPVSLAMMYGGATLTAPQLVAAGTIAFEEGSRDQLEEDSPNMPEIEKTIKALAMSSAETVFSSIGTGTIGQVYRDIIKKEGVEAGKVLFKDGLVEMYKSALKKYGAPIGLLGEGIEEAATQITQNLISGRPAFQGAADAFIIGGGSGVAFSAPINIIQAKEQINNIVETNKAKSDINTILKDNPSELYQIFNVSQAEPFTSEQIQITNTNKSRDVLVKNLAKNVKDGVITDEDAKQSVYIFDKAQQVSNAVKKLDVNNDEKTQIANLLSKRNNLKTEIETQDDALVVKQKQEVNNINQQISDIILNSKPVAQTGKDKAAAIRGQIKNIQENQLQKEVAIKTFPGLEKELREEFDYEYYENNLNSELDWQVNQAKEFLADPKAYFENIIDIAKRQIEDKPDNQVFKNVLATTTEELRRFNEITNKYKQDAIQEQTAGQVPVLTEAGVGEEVVQGEPKSEVEVVTEEGVKAEEVTKAPIVLTDVKADIEIRREEELEAFRKSDNYISLKALGRQNRIIEINAKYDAELQELEQSPAQQVGKAEAVAEPTIDLKKGDTVIWEGKESAILSTLKFGNEIKYNIDNGKEGGVWTNLITLKSESKKGLKAEKIKPTRTVAEIEKDQRVLMAKYHDTLKKAGIYELAMKNEADPAQLKKIRDRFKKDADRLKAEKESLTAKVEKGEEGVDAEAEKLLALLGAPKGEPKFRLSEGIEEPLTTDIEAIEKEMNDMPQVELDFVEPDVSQKGLKVNPVAESNSIVKIAKKIGNALLKPIQYFNGMPMITGMSDMLAAGRIKDSEGNYIDVDGGLLFNVLGKNKGAAWAGVTKEGAQAQYDNAVKLYKSNKELFDRLWSEGKLPDGHIPMAIMRMADTAVNSNEAVFRWILPTIEKFSKRNKVNAMKAFIESTKEKLNTTTEGTVESAKRILSFIEEKKIKSLDEFFKEIILDANNRAKGGTESLLALPSRSLIFDLIFAPKGIKKASKPTVKALLEGTDNSKNKRFTSDVIYNAIGEPSMLKSKQGEVVSIVGIDVKNGGVISVEHGNYGFGTKGKTIALIENPTHGIDVFPEWRAKASRVFKITKPKDVTKEGTIPSLETIASQTGGPFFTDKAFRGAKVLVGLIDDLNLLIGKLRFSFPSVSVSTTQKEFDNIINSPEVRTQVSDGKVILGVTKDGKIYLNPEMSSLQTPIHEFGHIWIDFLRSDASGQKGTDLLNKGLSLVKNTNAHKKAITKYGNTDIALEEALVELMANKGATIINAAKRSQFKSWMNATFKYIQKKFTTFKDLDINKIAKIKLDDFINTGLADLFSGKEVSAEFIPEQSESAFKARMSAVEDINEIIKIGRANNISEEAITKVLKDKDFNEKEIISAFVTIKAEEADKFAQEQLNSVMKKVDAFIARQKGRDIQDSKITSNIDTYLRKQDEYLNANDAQKKIIEREARAKMGAAPNRAVSIGRVLGALKDITNISREEKLKIISQIRKLSKDAAKDLAKEIRAMASSGKITQVQSANIIARFGKVNMLNEVSVSNFVDYMAKVFANAEYANKIDVAKSKLKNARQNIATKIGIADGIVGPLQRLFSINPALIPNLYLDRYLDLVNMFSARQAVLTLEDKSVVKSDTEAILREIDAEQSKADELADRFSNSENKVFKDNVLDYAASIRKMLEEDEIDQNEADIMRKYKSDIAPQVEKSKMTEEELAEEKDELLEALDSIEIDASGLPTKEERNLANRLKDLLSTNAIYKLSNVELKNLLKVLDNINNNYLPHYAQLMVEKLTAINNAKTLTSAIKKSVIAPLSGLYSRVKSFVLMSKRTAISEMIRRNPLFNIGEVFGDFKTKDIFNAVLNKVSEGESRFKTDLKRIQNILEKAEERVAKSFKLNANDTLMSKFKMMTYMVQLEYDSNQGSKQVNPAAEYLKATIKHIDEGKSQFGERDANMLQSILKKFETDGKIDNEKLYKSFNEAEKSAIKVIRGVNESLREKAEYTAAIIRGDRINPLTNYVHLNVLHEHKPNDLTSGVAFVNDYNNAMRPSTKAKSLIERTGKVSPLNFDIFASAQRGAKFVLMDYNLTEPIRTARKTIKQTIANFEEEGRVPKEKRQIINAIDSAFEEATENVLTNTFVTNSLADDVIDYIKKQGYRTVLAGTGRFISELTSNIGFAVIIDPKAFTTGIENRGFIMSVDAPLVMENVGSKQTNRVFPTDTLSGKLIDTNILQQASGIKGAKSKNPVANKIQQIWNLSGKKYVNAVELTADALISTPDKLIMRPMWFGSFANEFQKLTGEKVNFEKIAANDENYMEQYKSAIEKAKTIADEKSVMTGSTDNAFMGILKGTIKPDQSVTTRIFNNFNNFMTKFLIFEYITARAGINAAMGNGSLTKKQGVAVLGAVATRMVVYTLLTQMLGSGLIGLFFDDDEEETEKSFMQKLGQSITSAFTSLVFGRDFGNATKTIINYGLERANEKYLDFLREGEYDPYKDAIQYSIIPREKKGSITDISDLLLNVAGPLGPALKTGDLVIRKAFEPEKKESDAIQRQQDEINVRIPLEVLGNAGFIPLYKDIRKAVLKEMYSSLENPKKVINEKQEEVNQKVEALEKIKTNTKNKNVYNAIDEKINELQAGAEEKKNIKEENAEEKQRKEELLTNPVTGEKYDNESELKRYNKRLYNKNFGVRSEWYKEHRYEELVQKKMNLQIRKMEDRENRYRAPVKKTAKKRNSDGSFKRVSSR